MSGSRHCAAPMPRPPSSATLAQLKSVVGSGAWLDSPADIAPYLSDFRGLYHGATPLVLLPRNVDEVARILAICNRAQAAVVQHGGNVSYCGGAAPDQTG